MIRRHTIVCDACEADEMMLSSSEVSIELWPAEGWIEQEWQDGPTLHFCRLHADPDRRARLAEGFMLVCARCGRTTKDAEQPAYWTSGVVDGKRVTVCSDCFDSEADPFRI